MILHVRFLSWISSRKYKLKIWQHGVVSYKIQNSVAIVLCGMNVKVLHLFSEHTTTSSVLITTTDRYCAVPNEWIMWLHCNMFHNFTDLILPALSFILHIWKKSWLVHSGHLDQDDICCLKHHIHPCTCQIDLYDIKYFISRQCTVDTPLFLNYWRFTVPNLYYHYI